ncbi:MAG: TrmH family RNA methyltransferase, partial [Pseudomonadota bacterium]
MIAVIENPSDFGNIGTVIRNANALGVEKVYVVDYRGSLPEDWQEMRDRRSLKKTSASAIKWTFVKTFESTEACFEHLEKNGFESVVTSPHVKGKESYYLHESNFTEPAKLAVWFGNEARGISELAVKRSAFCVSIPMFGMIESMNLATS